MMMLLAQRRETIGLFSSRTTVLPLSGRGQLLRASEYRFSFRCDGQGLETARLLNNTE